MDLSVDKTRALGMATELVAETAWKQVLGSLKMFSGEGLQGEAQGDVFAQALAQELARASGKESDHAA